MKFFDAGAPTYQSMTQIEGYPYWFKVMVFVGCPQCGGEAILASEVNGGTIVKCQSCQFMQKHEGVDSGEIAKTVLAKLVTTAQ